MRKPGQEIKIARLSKGISLETLSAYADIPLKELVLIESCYKNASPRQLFRLATLLNIPHTALQLDMDCVETEISTSLERTISRAGPAKVDPQLVLIIGQFYRGSKPVHHLLTRDKKKIDVVELPSANRSFAYLGIGTTSQGSHHTPTYIILDTEIQHENYIQTTQAFHSVKRLQHVPVFLGGAEPASDLHRLSNYTNVYGSLARPTTPEAYEEQIIGLLSKVERLNDFM